MSLLKKDNWLLCFIINLFFPGIFSMVFVFGTNQDDKNAWYYKWQYWVFASICLIFPVFIMFIVFLIQMMVKAATILKVPGEEIYSSVYFWILCLIIPIVGWVVFISMLIYIWIWPIFMLEKGNGEKYIKK